MSWYEYFHYPILLIVSNRNPFSVTKSLLDSHSANSNTLNIPKSSLPPIPITQSPSQDNKNLIEETELQHERYEVTDQDITETCDIATEFKLFEEFQISVEKILLELEAAIILGCTGQTQLIISKCSKS